MIISSFFVQAEQEEKIKSLQASLDSTNNNLAETEQARAALAEEKVTTELKMVQMEEEKEGMSSPLGLIAFQCGSQSSDQRLIITILATAYMFFLRLSTKTVDK